MMDVRTERLLIAGASFVGGAIVGTIAGYLIARHYYSNAPVEVVTGMDPDDYDDEWYMENADDADGDEIDSEEIFSMREVNPSDVARDNERLKEAKLSEMRFTDEERIALNEMRNEVDEIDEEMEMDNAEATELNELDRFQGEIEGSWSGSFPDEWLIYVDPIIKEVPKESYDDFAGEKYSLIYFPRNKVAVGFSGLEEISENEIDGSITRGVLEFIDDTCKYGNMYVKNTLSTIYYKIMVSDADYVWWLGEQEQARE